MIRRPTRLTAATGTGSRFVVLDEYLLHKKERVRAKTFGEVRRYLTGSYFRQLHGMPVDAVTRKDVASVLVTITKAALTYHRRSRAWCPTGFLRVGDANGFDGVQPSDRHLGAGHGQSA